MRRRRANDSSRKRGGAGDVRALTHAVFGRLGHVSRARREFSIRGYVDDHLARADRAVIRGVRSKTQDVLERARAGDVRLDELQPLLAPIAVSARGTLVVRSVVESVRAYLFYRRGDHENAVASLARAFDADLQLEHEGLDLMAAHRVQLVVNTLAVALKRGRPEAAIAAAVAVLSIGEAEDYRALGALDRPWSIGWDRAIPPIVLGPIRELGTVVLTLLEGHATSLEADNRSRWVRMLAARDTEIARAAPGRRAAWEAVRRRYAGEPA